MWKGKKYIVEYKAYINTDYEEFYPNQVNMSHENDSNRDSPDLNLLVTDVGLSKIEKLPIHVATANEYLSNNSLSSPIVSTTIFSNSLEKISVFDVCLLLENRSKQSIVDSATSLPANALLKTSARSMVSHLSRVGKKRKDRDDQLDVHDKKMSKKCVHG
ncbi:hypothetical protein ACH5RR_026447 [Cinchona calisaya]|uniref:Uncharacterized protein n=1 Tax=Cinchona calisaya TaxID=153742 RepID=A0ABD2Z5X3_9GENT